MVLRSLAVVLTITLLIPQVTYSQNQVTPAELKQAIEAVAQTRQKNLEEVRGFLSSDPIQTVLKTANVDQSRLEKAVSTLTADELARLASRTRAIQTDFAAGSLSNQELTYVVIALAAAVLVLVVVAA